MIYGNLDRSKISSFDKYIKQQNLTIHKLGLKLRKRRKQAGVARKRLEETIHKKQEKPEIIITEASLLQGAKIVSMGCSVLDRIKAYEDERLELVDKINILVSRANGFEVKL